MVIDTVIIAIAIAMIIIIIVFMVIVISFDRFGFNLFFYPIISADMNIMDIEPNILAIYNHVFLLILGE